MSAASSSACDTMRVVGCVTGITGGVGARATAVVALLPLDGGTIARSSSAADSGAAPAGKPLKLRMYATICHDVAAGSDPGAVSGIWSCATVYRSLSGWLRHFAANDVPLSAGPAPPWRFWPWHAAQFAAYFARPALAWSRVYQP